MTWNYRIVKYADGTGYGLHEVHYDKNGEPVSMSAEPTGFVSETPHGIHDAMLIARTDARHRPVFVEPPDWE